MNPGVTVNLFHSPCSTRTRDGKRKWTDTLQNCDRQPFTSPTGPTLTIHSEPVEVFNLFFTDELMSDIVHHTNLYAAQTMDDHQAEKWVPVTVEDLRAYLGFCVLMGIVRLPALDDCWRTDPYLHYDPIASRITRDRFRDIRRYLHFVDNDSLPSPGTPGSDRLAKIRPLFNYVNGQCLKVYNPSRDVSVDEAMVKFQGRSSLKQYIPMKPVKRGIKVWVLADVNGNMQVYTGRENSVEKGLGSRVVKDLTRPLQHKFHYVYCDNFFTSVQLLEDLEEVGLYTCGTARSDRTGFPPDLKKIKLDNRYIG